jgi:hypothetical protein
MCAYRRNLSSTEVAQPSCESPGAAAYLRNVVAGRARPAGLYSPPRSAAIPALPNYNRSSTKGVNAACKPSAALADLRRHELQEDLGRYRRNHAQTAANHDAVPIGVCASDPDVRQGALGGRRVRLDGVNSCFGSGGALFREFAQVRKVDTPGFLSCHTLLSLCFARTWMALSTRWPLG